MPQTLQNIMTTNIASVSPQQTVQEAAKLMKELNVGSIPVVESGQVTGIITDRDITLRTTASGVDSHTSVSQCMTNHVVTANSTMDVHEAAELMAQQQIRRLPVVDNGQLVGMVAIGDLAVENIYQNEAGEALSSISNPSFPHE
ncbi:CBS domain-containing protein [Alkalihalobacterium alkalinitrilicum]|uniref:CBS domain-containing protein n=1 Tax=Alkalihalobacterium alkalinitrilicum TaxID=427920 RepID=UPI00099501E2|nr:CBS domain-containing protein [Alkalihalobacterium alkalinitrilicum]